MSGDNNGGAPSPSDEPKPGEASAGPEPDAAKEPAEVAEPAELPRPMAMPQTGVDLSAIVALERTYHEGRKRERPPLLASRFASGGLFVVLIGFLGLILIELQTRFSSWEAFEPHVQAQVQALGPQVTEHLKEVAAELAPVYGRMAQERLQASIPQLQVGAAEEWDRLRQGLRVRTEGQVRDVIRRQEDRQWSKIQTAFPSLSNPTTRTAFEERLRAQLEADAEEVLAAVHVRFSEDAKRLVLALEGFNNPTLVAMHDDQLARHFVRLLLLLVDRKLVELDRGHPVPTRDLRAPRAGDGRQPSAPAPSPEAPAEGAPEASPTPPAETAPAETAPEQTEAQDD